MNQLYIVILSGWAITAIVLGVLLRRYSLRCRHMRRKIKYVSTTCDCIINLLDEATHSLKENVSVSNFLTSFTDYSARSLHAESAAFFSYDKKKHTVKAEAISGVFPILFNAPEKALGVVSSSPERLKNYLTSKQLPLNSTPFGEAITEQHPIIFDKDDLKKRLKIVIGECWNMMIIPVTTESVFGVFVAVNKANRSDFNQNDIHLAVGMAETAGITISQILSFQEIQEKRRIDSQLKDASIIQKHLLPQSVPASDKFDIATYYQTAFHIGGDYYDFIDIDDDHLGIVIADVSGKGTTAGLVMATARSLFSVIARGELSPRYVLCKLNEHLVKLIPAEMFISVTYAILNQKTGQLVWARAGHEPILYCSVGKDTQTLGSGNGMVVGMLAGPAFEESLTDEYFNLSKGDVILFYTDGVTEANNSENKEFGELNLANALKTITKMDSQQSLNLIVHRLSRFTHDQPAYDDMTLVLVRVK